MSKLNFELFELEKGSVILKHKGICPCITPSHTGLPCACTNSCIPGVSAHPGIRSKMLRSSTTRTPSSRATTSWTSGFSPSPSPSFSSSGPRWMVRTLPFNTREACTKLAQSRQFPCGCGAHSIGSRAVTSVSHCSVPPVHGGAAPRQVRGHAHQLVREDQPPPAQGEASADFFFSNLFSHSPLKWNSQVLTDH